MWSLLGGVFNFTLGQRLLQFVHARLGYFGETQAKAYELLKPVVAETRELSDEDIINYMMIPLCLETVRCLEDGIVETAAEADMGLIYGIGFPPFRGGALRYIDSIGVAEFVAMADKYADLGPLYHPTAKLREMAANGQRFYG